MRLSVIVPCLNEAKTITQVLHEVDRVQLPNGWDKEIIVVDDGSTDATREILRTITSRSELVTPVTVILKDQNGGKGAAVRAGLERVTGEYIIIQDADLEYDPRDYYALVTPIAEKRADTVFGSRTLKKNNVPYNAVYFYGGLLVTRFFNLLFWTSFSDIATCYKVFNRKHIPALLASHHKDFVFDAVDLTRTLQLGGIICEVPISYRARNKKEGKKLSAWAGMRIVGAIVLSRLGLTSAAQEKFIGETTRFLISGTCAALVNIATLYVFVAYVRLWYIPASVISFLVAFTCNFVLQKYWTFKSLDRQAIRRQLPLHFIAAFTNLILNVLILYMLVEYVHLWYITGQIITSALIAIESFFTFRWIFR
jgi:dolichol-phosphate mannosyltransferase